MARAIIVLLLGGLLPVAVIAQAPPRDRAATARLSGRVVDAATGARMAGAVVALTRDQRLRTDREGEFVMAGVAQGNHQVTVTKTGYLPQTLTMSAGKPAIVELIKAGAISGRIVDALGEPAARVPVGVRRYQYEADGRRTAVVVGISDSTDDLGQFRVYGLPAGDYVVAAQAARGPNDPVRLEGTPTGFNDRSTDSGVTYYPGTLNPAEAQTVSLGVGGEASVHFMNLTATLVRVLGTAVTSDGKPAAGLTASLRSATVDWLPSRTGGTIASDGQFLFNRVPPGRYWIDVGGADGRGEFASVPIVVGEDELSGVTIVTAPGTAIRGRVTFDGPRPPAFSIKAAPVEGTGAIRRPGDSARIADTGEFELTNVVGRVLLSPDTDGWFVTSAVVDGQETVDTPFDVTGRGTLFDVRVTVSNRGASIAGRVADQRQRPLSGQAVVLLRTEPTGLVRHRLRVVRTGADGGFRIDGLREGPYVIGAMSDLATNYQFSPDFQERLRQHGQRFTLAAGESVTIELAPAPDLP